MVPCKKIARNPVYTFMKKERKQFIDGLKSIVYKPQTGIAHIRAESLYEAKNFLMKHMDKKDIGIVHGLAVTLSLDPRVTIMIRGKNLFKFIQSELNERESYRSKKSFTSLVEKPQPKNVAELVIYCPGTRRFLMGQSPDRKTIGFPTTVVLSYEAHQDAALKTLTTLTNNTVTSKHVKHINDVDMKDGSKHHVYLMIAKHEFDPFAQGAGLVWLRHDVGNLNTITDLLVKDDPTIGKIIANEDSPEKLDFSKLVEDMVD